jgi:hypothetical protein
LSTSRAIVVLSCDKYSDLWSPVMNNLICMLSDIPLDKYLVTNEIIPQIPGVKVIPTGPDRDWSTSLKTALKQIPEKSILLILDDMALFSKPSYGDLESSFEILEANKLGALHPRPVPPQRHWHENNDKWYEYSKFDSYTSNVYAFWDKDLLEKLVVEGESAWDFEVHGTKRLNKLSRVGALKKAILDCSNLVIKGKWAQDICEVNSQLDLGLDLNSRERSTKNRWVHTIRNGLFDLIFNFFPRRLQSVLFAFFHRINRS